MIVGRVAALWRYPVKSMLGERVERAWLGPNGIEGDRVWALRDAETGRLLSAKKVSRLLTARSRTSGREVQIELPTGEALDAGDPAAGKVIGGWLGRDVELVLADGGTERPVIENEQGTFRGRAGGFFDSSVVHFVTTSTLGRLAELQPGGVFDARRFRPNVVLETLEPGFVEEEWVGSTLELGGALIEITKPCSRCVMTTHAQEDLPVDRDVLRTVRDHNDEHAGIYGIVREAESISLGDEALLG
ncbi:MAG: MOSC N-terminal beta barrel domain-containing protein [Actinomycetota bacterium]